MSGIQRFFKAALYGIRDVRDSLGDELPRRTKIQFLGVPVTDDPDNATTVVDMTSLPIGVGITSVTGSSPILVNNSDPTNPIVSIAPSSNVTPGSMSMADKIKMDTLFTIAASAPITFTNVSGTRYIGVAEASMATRGTMSAADKVKLDASTDLPTVSTIVMRDIGGRINATSVSAPAWFSEATPMTIDMDGVGTPFFTFSDDPKIVAGYEIEAPSFKRSAAVTSLYRSAPLIWRGLYVSMTESWVPTATGTCKQNLLEAGAECHVQLDLEHGSVLTNVRFRSEGAGDALDPDAQFMPTYSIIRQHFTTLVETVVGTGADGAAAGGVDYRTSHLTEITCSNHVVDRSTYRYYAKITPEYGTDSQLGFQLDGIMVGYDYPAGFVIGQR